MQESSEQTPKQHVAIDIPNEPVSEKRLGFGDASALVQSTVLSFLEYKDQLILRGVSTRFYEWFAKSKSGTIFNTKLATLLFALLPLWELDQKTLHLIWGSQSATIPKAPFQMPAAKALVELIMQDQYNAYRIEMLNNLEKITAFKESLSAPQHFFHTLTDPNRSQLPKVGFLFSIVAAAVCFGLSACVDKKNTGFLITGAGIALMIMSGTIKILQDKLSRPYVSFSEPFSILTFSIACFCQNAPNYLRPINAARLKFYAVGARELLASHPETTNSKEVDWNERLAERDTGLQEESRPSAAATLAYN